MTPRQRTPRHPTAGRDFRSYLVRVWGEPEAGEGRRSRALAYVRELRSGEERYFTDLGQVGDYLRGGPADRAVERDSDSGSPRDGAPSEDFEISSRQSGKRG